MIKNIEEKVKEAFKGFEVVSNPSHLFPMTVTEKKVIVNPDFVRFLCELCGDRVLDYLIEHEKFHLELKEKVPILGAWTQNVIEDYIANEVLKDKYGKEIKCLFEKEEKPIEEDIKSFAENFMGEKYDHAAHDLLHILNEKDENLKQYGLEACIEFKEKAKDVASRLDELSREELRSELRSLDNKLSACVRQIFYAYVGYLGGKIKL